MSADAGPWWGLRYCCLCGGITCGGCAWPEELLLTFAGFSDKYGSCGCHTLLNRTFTVKYWGEGFFYYNSFSVGTKCIYHLKIGHPCADRLFLAIDNTDTYISISPVAPDNSYFGIASRGSRAACEDLDGFQFSGKSVWFYPCARDSLQDLGNLITARIEYP